MQMIVSRGCGWWAKEAPDQEADGRPCHQMTGKLMENTGRLSRGDTDTVDGGEEIRWLLFFHRSR